MKWCHNHHNNQNIEHFLRGIISVADVARPIFAIFNEIITSSQVDVN